MFKKIYIEITNNCNLNCDFCIGNERIKKFISKNEFKILIDKLDGYTKYLYFHVMGEPLLHPDINELIDMAKEKFFVNITTNGYLIKKIVNNKSIRQINVSLHSYNIKYKKSIDEYMDDIFLVSDNLIENGTYFKYRLWVGNENKDIIIKKLEEKYNVSIGDLEKVKLAHNVYYEVENEFVWPSLENSYYDENGTCMGCRSHIGILVDGTVIPCCLDSAGVINLGNIYKQDLNDIISSEIFISLKNGFLNNKKIHNLCRKCSFYEERNKK